MKEVSADSNLCTLEFQALETKNTQLKEELTAVESKSNVSSRAAVFEKPKVLAPGLYAMTPKYIPHQKRNNKEANTPLSKEREVASTKPLHMIAPGSSRTVGLRVGSYGKLFHTGTTKVDSESINGSDEDITNQYEYKQTLDVNARKVVVDSVAERLEQTTGCFFRQTDLSLSSTYISGRWEHEEMGAFIREFETTNELLLKERNNSLSELEFEVLEKRKGSIGFNIEIKDKKGAENLDVDHLLRLENPNMGELADDEITDKFPDEHLMILKVKLNDEDPWYADY
ncbi:hypothetical protein Tco_0096807 [Tanacetum coccineum]